MNTARAERGRLKMEMWGIFICKGISFLLLFLIRCLGVKKSYKGRNHKLCNSGRRQECSFRGYCKRKKMLKTRNTELKRMEDFPNTQ